MGKPTFPLTQQIASSVATHGRAWALWHYCINRRGPQLAHWEWAILARSAACTQ